MHVRIITAGCLAVLGLAFTASRSPAQPSLDWFLIDGIGGVSMNGAVAIVATVSAEDADFAAQGTVSIHSVFQPAQIFHPSTPPSEASLQISHATNHITIRWSVFFASNQIESATSLLGPATTWSNVAPLPVSENGQWHLTLPADPSPRFFRLRLP